MAGRKREGTLSAEEKRIVKALLKRGWRNQDIQALVNILRAATINSARVTEVKKNDRQRAASDDEVEFYLLKKKSYDQRTGLNLFDDERLIRAREAMILAVQIFNSTALNFKTEVFSVLANVGWTYLLHEFYDRKKVEIIGGDGRSLLLIQMVERDDCPLSEGVKNNLRSLKVIRDDVEHKLFGKSDAKWLGLFQACCLNFDNYLCKLFGDELTLAKELSFALQFAKLGIDQISELHKFEVPEHIEALDARLQEGLTDEQLADLEYKFRVIYTLDSASKSRSHIHFVRPDSVESDEIRNVLVHYKAADHFYPYKPGNVCPLVSERIGQPFSSHNHTQAWMLFEVRPRGGARQPENTNKDYCIYHPVHKDYTYSEKWLEKLIEEAGVPEKLDRIKAMRIGRR